MRAVSRGEPRKHHESREPQGNLGSTMRAASRAAVRIRTWCFPAGSDVAELAAAELGDELARQLGEGDLPAADQVGLAMQRAFLELNERFKSMQALLGLASSPATPSASAT